MCDPELIAALVAGRPGAADEMYAAGGPLVLRGCARIGGPHVNEEDAAQDVFERVLERIHTVRDPAAFPGWLYACTRRVVIDHRRRAWVRRWFPGVLEAVDPAAEHRVERDDLVRAVREVIDTLPQDLREVLVLCEMEDRDAAEVSELVGVPLGTVKSRLRRARERFAAEARRRGLTPDGRLVEAR